MAWRAFAFVCQKEIAALMSRPSDTDLDAHVARNNATAQAATRAATASIVFSEQVGDSEQASEEQQRPSSTPATPQPPLASPTLFVNPVVDYQRAHVDRRWLLESSNTAATENHTEATTTSKVLILYSGGTIGMQAVPGQGYVPVENFFTQSLAKMARFHDAPSSSSTSSSTSTDFVTLHNIDTQQAERREVPVLMTPVSLYGKRIRYSVLEYSPLLDSSNMRISDWQRIARDLELNYPRFDAFVIVHGTDTMAYTASALSFMLEDLGKTVVLTGSQVPLSEWRTDAEQNLLGALLIAGHFVIPEVCVFFDNKLLRGNRAIKVNAMDFAAFESPNMKPLATFGVNIDVNWRAVRRPNSVARFQAHKSMDTRVGVLRIFPSIDARVVESFLLAHIRGVVLETYGAGNAPTNRPDLLALLKHACDRGVVIVNITQCKRGYVSDMYATGKALADIGIVPGGDMTAVCALTKLSYLLGKGRSPEDVRKLIAVNLRGELTILPYLKPFEQPPAAHKTFVHSNFIHNVINVLGAETDEERQLIQNALLPHLICATAGLNDLSGYEKLSHSSSQAELINATDFDGRTALHIAAASGHLQMAERLIKAGASVHLRDRHYQTPLVLACRHGNSEVAKLLVQSGANLDGDDLNIKWLFFQAVACGDVARVRLLVDCGWAWRSAELLPCLDALAVAQSSSPQHPPMLEYLSSLYSIK